MAKSTGEKSKGKELQDFLPFQLTEKQKRLRVNNLQTDNRHIQPGDMFLAYPGVAVDGRQFAGDAAANGAVCVLAEKAVTDEQQNWLSDMPCELIEVDQLQPKIGEIAAAFFEYPSKQLDVIAVTGTNGKTSVSQLIAQAISLLGEKTALMGTLGNGFVDELLPTQNTTPGALDVQRLFADFLEKGARAVALEASSHGLEQGRLLGTNVDCAVVTNISRDHLDFHGSMEAYQAAKARLVVWPGLKQLVVNCDDPIVVDMTNKAAGSVKVLRYSVQDKSAELYATDLDYSDDGLHFVAHYGNEAIAVRSSLLGEFNVSNLLAVMGVLLLRGYSLKKVAKILAGLQPIPGRMEQVSIKRQHVLPTVIVDYAHTPDALIKALKAVRRHCKGELWCVFGCGGDRDKGKRALMGEAAARLADKIVLTSDNPRSEDLEDILKAIESGFSATTDYFVKHDRKAAIQEAISEAIADDCVLIAGKGHEDYQEINGEKLPFSDVKVARKALKKRRQDLESSCI